MLNNQRFGPIKQWGFLVENLHLAIQRWVKQAPDRDTSQQCHLVSL